MEQKTIIEMAYNYTSELLKKNKVDIITTTGKTIRVDYTIEKSGNFTIYSITTPYSILEQEVYEMKDDNGNVIKQDNKFNTGLVHSHIVGLIRNY